MPGRAVQPLPDLRPARNPLSPQQNAGFAQPHIFQLLDGADIACRHQDRDHEEGEGKLDLLGPMLLALLCPDLCNLCRPVATVALRLMQLALLALAFARLRIVALDHPFRTEMLLDVNLVMDT